MVTTSLWLGPKIAPFPHIYMNVYIYTNVYVHMCASAYICPVVCMCVHICKCGYVCIHMWAYPCVHICVCICVFVCLCTSGYVCICLSVCVDMYVFNLWYCSPYLLRLTLSLAWNLTSESQGCMPLHLPALGLQEHTTTPGFFSWLMRVWIQVPMCM